MRSIRLSIVGLGVVGRWLSEAIERRRAWLERECHVRVLVVSAATRRGGLVHRSNGLDVPTLVSLVAKLAIRKNRVDNEQTRDSTNTSLAASVVGR